jgi:hypothetical protein
VISTVANVVLSWLELEGVSIPCFPLYLRLGYHASVPSGDFPEENDPAVQFCLLPLIRLVVAGSYVGLGGKALLVDFVR